MERISQRKAKAQARRAVAVASAGPNPEEGRCNFFVATKNRHCKMLCLPNERYCGEHMNEATVDGGRRRVPCPLDPKHTVFEDYLQRHMAKCNSRPAPKEPFYELGINRPGSKESSGSKNNEEIKSQENMENDGVGKRRAGEPREHCGSYFSTLGTGGAAHTAGATGSASHTCSCVNSSAPSILTFSDEDYSDLRLSSVPAGELCELIERVRAAEARFGEGQLPVEILDNDAVRKEIETHEMQASHGRG